MVRAGWAVAGCVVALVGCSSLLGDFDVGGGAQPAASGDDGGADATGGGGGGDEGDGGGDGAAPIQPGAPGDAAACPDGSCALSCSGKEQACGDHCADLAASRTDCGACGHGCGGGECASGVCQPVTLVQGIDTPTGFAIDDGGFFFASGGTLKRCPPNGCGAGATQIASLVNLSLVGAAGSSIAFVGNDPTITSLHTNPTSLFACPATGCPATLPPRIEGGFPPGFTITYGFNQLVGSGPDLFVQVTRPGATASQFLDECLGLSGTSCGSIVSVLDAFAPIAVDASRVYFLRDEGDASTGTKDLVSCTKGTACSSPQVVLAGIAPSKMAAFGGNVYFVTIYAPPLGGGPIFSCPASGCTKAIPFATLPQDPVEDVVADATGVYFTAGGRVYTCPLAGCGAVGPRALATGQAHPTTVRVDARFVYWVNAGVADAGASASIMRVAK